MESPDVRNKIGHPTVGQLLRLTFLDSAQLGVAKLISLLDSAMIVAQPATVTMLYDIVTTGSWGKSNRKFVIAVTSNFNMQDFVSVLSEHLENIESIGQI